MRGVFLHVRVACCCTSLGYDSRTEDDDDDDENGSDEDDEDDDNDIINGNGIHSFDNMISRFTSGKTVSSTEQWSIFEILMHE